MYLITDRWRWVAASVIGLLVVSIAIVVYFAWNSKKGTDSAILLRKAVSLLGTDTRSPQDSANPANGLKIMHDVLSRYPGTAAAIEATLRLGAHYYAAGQYDEARTVYVTYLNKNPRGQIAFTAGIGVGDTYLAQHSHEKAIETYSQLIEQFPQEPLLPEAHLHLARAYRNANRLKDGLIIYEKIVATYPNTGWAQSAQAELYRASLTTQ
jgi:TolA-binding protein